MAIDRKYIFDKCTFYLRKETLYFTSSDLHKIIGIDSFRRIAEDIKFPRTVFSSYMTSGQWVVSVSGIGFLKLDENKDVTYKDSSNTTDLKEKSQINIGRAAILTATPGTPTNYFMEAEKSIGVYPPSTSGCINIPYVMAPVSLSSDTDVNELTEDCYQAAVYWTVAECMLRDNDERYVIYEKRYNREIVRLQGRFGEMFEEDYNIAPDERYLE